MLYCQILLNLTPDFDFTCFLLHLVKTVTVVLRKLDIHCHMGVPLMLAAMLMLTQKTVLCLRDHVIFWLVYSASPK